MQKVIRFVVVVLLFGYLSVCTFLYFNQTNMVFHPKSENPVLAKKYQQYAMQFEINGEQLYGWMRLDNPYSVVGNMPVSSETNISPSPFILYFGGQDEEVSNKNVVFPTVGITNYLLLNYRSYGRSTGIPSEQALKADAIEIYDKLINEFSVPEEAIIIFGNSLGSGVATYLASERPTAKIILNTPYDSMVAVAQNRFPILPVSLLMKNRFESDKLAPEINTPVLCLLAEYDQIVPTKHANKLCGAWGGQANLVTVPKARHNTILTHREAQQAIRNFVAN